MKRELKLIVDSLEKGFGKHIAPNKLAKLLHVGRRPSAATLDKLALLAGFQCWDELREALRGEDDGSWNFGSDEKKA